MDDSKGMTVNDLRAVIETLPKEYQIYLNGTSPMMALEVSKNSVILWDREHLNGKEKPNGR